MTDNCRTDSSECSTRHKIPLLSFFTGAGFLDMGFLKAGFDVVWHNEYNKSFVHGFEYGMPRLKAYDWFPDSDACCRIQNTNSIEDTNREMILAEAFPQGTPEIFGIIGGPPCPDFSIGGKNRGASGDNGKLSQVYVDRIMDLQPTFFLFENVKGLLRTKKHRAYLDRLKVQLSQSYALSLRLLNALEYGAPQDRERMFLVGFRRDWLHKQGLVVEPGGEEWFPWPIAPYADAKKQAWPTQSPVGSTPNVPDLPAEFRNLMVGTWICEDDLTGLENGKEGFAPKSLKFATIAEGDDSKKSFKRLHRYRYSPTVAYGNNEVHLHPILPRRLTVREALRLQTVPNAYALPEHMSLSDKFKTIGNGVPVILAKAVAQAFLDILTGKATAEQLR